MRIGIVGWGIEGQSAYRYFGPEHDYLIVNEEPRGDLPAKTDKIKVQCLPGQRMPGLTGNVANLSYMDGLENCDKVIYTGPAAKNLEKKFGQDKHFWGKATTTQHIFFEKVATKNIIGVTGSKGKGTTSTLIYEMLKAAGKKTFLGGNIGNSPLDFIGEVQPDDWVVLELSNFQLYKLTYSPRVAVCLIITTEHQDWHPDMEDYVQAKANIFRHQKDDDVAVYFAENDYSKRLAGYSPGRKVPYYAAPGARVRADGIIVIGDNEQEVISKTEVKLLGEHNLQNICAACTAVFEALRTVDNMRAVLSSFSGLEHRLEFVREFEGVKYYDDSFGTTPDTAIVAMRAMVQPQILILGGSDKGLDLEPMVKEAIKDRTRQVITIGTTGPRIEEMLRQRGFDHITSGLTKMSDIVAAARRAAEPGDVVLLSPGCASFGLFKDYKDRGNQFKTVVQALV